jgi:hypothetical protein
VGVHPSSLFEGLMVGGFGSTLLAVLCCSSTRQLRQDHVSDGLSCNGPDHEGLDVNCLARLVSNECE